MKAGEAMLMQQKDIHSPQILLLYFSPMYMYLEWVIWLEGNKVISTDMHRPNDALIGKKLNHVE